VSAGLRALHESDVLRAEAVQSFIASYRHSPETQRTLASSLGTIAEALWGSRKAVAVVEWDLLADPVLYDLASSSVAARVGPRSCAKARWALDGLLRHLARVGIADFDDVALATSQKRRTPSQPPAGRSVTTEEFAAMLRACRRDTNTAKGTRDAALIALLGGVGLRRAEVARLRADQLDLQAAVATFVTKGGKQRTALLHPAVVEHVAEWMTLHPDQRGPLFIPVAKNGVARAGAALNDRSVYRIVARRRDEAGAHPDISPHSFRRHFVTELLDNGADLLTTMRAVGHTSPATTQKYDRRPDMRVRQAVDDLEIPTVCDLDDG
jgi:integrase